jgi:hypothetical protein
MSANGSENFQIIATTRGHSSPGRDGNDTIRQVNSETPIATQVKSWGVEFIGVCVLAFAGILFFFGESLFPPAPGGGFFSPAVMAAVLRDIGALCLLDLGLLLFIVRPVMWLHWRPMPYVLLMIGVPLWFGRVSFCDTFFPEFKIGPNDVSDAPFWWYGRHMNCLEFSAIGSWNLIALGVLLLIATWLGLYSAGNRSERTRHRLS